MAILYDEVDEHSFKRNSVKELSDRLEVLELQVNDIQYNLNDVDITLYLQKLKMDDLESKKQHPGYQFEKSWKERLIFKSQNIKADSVWRGSVDNCFTKISKNLRMDNHSYIGSTCDPERRLREHVRKTNLSTDIQFDRKETKSSFIQMNILYHTTSCEKVADMESRLLLKYPYTKNAVCHANGVLYGKPSYFVYILRFLRGK